MTKQITKDSLFNAPLIHSKIKIKGKSLITFNSFNPGEMPKTDWVFFTSKNSVRFFFKQGYKISNQKIGCVGKGTFKILSSHVNHIDYVGESIDTNIVGKEFSELVGSKKCLFPISNISKRTIQNHLINQSNSIDFVVYETHPLKDFKSPKASILVFTSPSNAINYHKTNTIKPHQKLIAMGKTTGKQLEDLGFKEYTIPKTTGEIGLIDAINNIVF